MRKNKKTEKFLSRIALCLSDFCVFYEDEDDVGAG